MTSQTGQQIIAIHILPNISRSKDNQTTKMMLKLKKIENEGLNGLTGDDARPDVRARGVWRQGQNVFFDIRLANTNARSQKHLPVSAILKKHEKESL